MEVTIVDHRLWPPLLGEGDAIKNLKCFTPIQVYSPLVLGAICEQLHQGKEEGEEEEAGEEEQAPVENTKQVLLLELGLLHQPLTSEENSGQGGENGR